APTRSTSAAWGSSRARRWAGAEACSSPRRSGETNARLLDRRGDPLDLDALVGVVLSLAAVELRNVRAPGVVERDQPPLIVEHGAAGAAALGGSPVVHEALVVVEQRVVAQREGEPATFRVPDDVDLLLAVVGGKPRGDREQLGPRHGAVQAE